MDIGSQRKRRGVVGRISRTAVWQFAIFLVLLLLIWVNEVLDFSSLFFDADPDEVDFIGACILTACVLLVAIISVGYTYLAHQRMLSGFVTLCSRCRRVQIDEAAWEGIEEYILDHSKVEFSHGLCPECYAREVEAFQASGDGRRPEPDGASVLGLTAMAGGALGQVAAAVDSPAFSLRPLDVALLVLAGLFALACAWLWPLRRRLSARTKALESELTERRRAEERLRAQQSLSHMYLETVQVMIVVLDRDGCVSLINQRGCEILGYAREELLGRNWFETCLPPVHREEVTAVFRELMAGRQEMAEHFENAVLTRSGEERTIAWHNSILRNSRGDVIGTLSSGDDVTEQRRTQEAMQESEARFRELFDQAPVGYHTIDARGRITSVNRTELEMLGYAREEMLGREVWDFVIESDRSRRAVLAKLRGAQPEGRAAERAFKKRDGGAVPVLITDRLLKDAQGRCVGIRTTLEDISERKRVEEDRRQLAEQLLQSQKLESMGVLAGGIAHEFNNLLTGILGNVDLAQDDIDASSPARESLLEIESAAKHAAELCRQMLAYSGKGRFIVESVVLNNLLRDLEPLLRASVSKKTVFRMQLAEKLPAVEADAGQLRQLVMNLVTNAGEAIGGDSGVVSLSTGTAHCDREYLRRTLLDESLQEGEYVSLEVSDTGAGMDRETLERIFDPFYTTKFTGRGLGLAAVLGIVRGHGGALKAYSEPGQGTSMRVLLPALPAEAPAAEEARPSAAGAAAGGDTVLLADDEQTVRDVGRRMLEKLGASVVAVADGREAVEAFERDPNRFTCVILDLSMPNMDGKEAFRRIRRIRDGVPIVLSSGYNRHDVVDRFAGKSMAGFVQKPYQMAELRELLGNLSSRPVQPSSAGRDLNM